MTPHKTIAAIAVYLGILITPFAQADWKTPRHGELEGKIVTELYRSSVYQGHLFHLGHLFVSRSRTSEIPQHYVSIFDREQKLAANISLTHSATYIRAYGDNAVIVTGRSSDPWRSHYSIIRQISDESTVGQGFSIETVTFPLEYMMEDFAGDSEMMFFNEPGSRGVFLFDRPYVENLGFEVSNPGNMTFDGENLFVVARRSFYWGDENIVKIAIPSYEHQEIFKENRQGLTEMILFPAYNLIAASESAASQVLFVDAKTSRLTDSVSVPGTPRGLALLGSCVAVVSSDEKKVSFIARVGDSFELIRDWDVSFAGDILKQPSKIAIDPAGVVYLRSTYACPTCTSTQSSVFSFREVPEQRSKSVTELCHPV
jgi:hypothetical protein